MRMRHLGQRNICRLADCTCRSLCALVGNAFRLINWQRVHVRPQSNNRPAISQCCHHPSDGIRVPAKPAHSIKCSPAYQIMLGYGAGGIAHLYGMSSRSRWRRNAADVSDSLYSTSGIACNSLRTSVIQGLIALAASRTTARLVSVQLTQHSQQTASTAAVTELMCMEPHATADTRSSAASMTKRCQADTATSLARRRAYPRSYECIVARPTDRRIGLMFKRCKGAQLSCRRDRCYCRGCYDRLRIAIASNRQLYHSQQTALQWQPSAS